jgi:hypothetical protein
MAPALGLRSARSEAYLRRLRIGVTAPRREESAAKLPETMTPLAVKYPVWLIVQLGVVTKPLNRAWYERNTGRTIIDVQRHVRHPVNRWMAATLDGMVENVRAPGDRDQLFRLIATTRFD